MSEGFVHENVPLWPCGMLTVSLVSDLCWVGQGRSGQCSMRLESRMISKLVHAIINRGMGLTALAGMFTGPAPLFLGKLTAQEMPRVPIHSTAAHTIGRRSVCSLLWTCSHLWWLPLHSNNFQPLDLVYVIVQRPRHSPCCITQLQIPALIGNRGSTLCPISSSVHGVSHSVLKGSCLLERY